MKKILSFAFTVFLFTSSFAQNFNSSKLDSLFNILAANNKYMGNVAVAQNGKTIYAKAIGKADVETGKDAKTDSKYRIGSISKTFTGHDYNVGQVNLFGVFNAVSGLVKKVTKPKITKANYNETQDFLKRVRNEVNLSFLKKYGMDEEQIDTFLLYAEKTRSLAKRYRKDFQISVVEYELKIAFGEYSKMNKLEGTKE